MPWIVTENPERDVWEHLLEYTNQDVALERIVAIHGPPTSTSLEKNYVKQAKQVRTCLEQAKEYFEAAKLSSIVTSPNHLYYGACALISAAMLMNGDGTRSLDCLRKDGRNRRHGMTLGFDFLRCNSVEGVTLLEAVKCTADEYGLLPQAYDAMRALHSHSLVVRYGDGGKFSYSFARTGLDVKPPYPRYRKFSALELCCRLPDLDWNLRRLSLRRAFVRCVTSMRGRDLNGEIWWNVHDSVSAQDEDLLFGLFLFEPRCLRMEHYDKIRIDRYPHGGLVTKVPLGEGLSFEYPSSRFSLQGDETVIVSSYQSWEWLDSFMVSYMLSMLSRYFPDIWMSCLDSRCGSAALARRFVTVYVRKFPQLALDLITGDKTVFSVQPHPTP